MYYEVETEKFGKVKVTLTDSIASIADTARGYLEDDSFADILWDTKVQATKEEQVEDVERMLALYKKIVNRDIESYLNLLNTKKNGKFKKGAVTVVAYLSCNTSYYTDFTNAWITPRLFIRALSENEVMVSLDRQTLS